jgi:hypothetical protein
MSRSRVPIASLTTLIAIAFAIPAAAQGTACTTPFDPACTHLKCYQIKDKPSTVVSKSPVLQLDNQFGREVVYRLQAVLLCVPTLKSCCCPGLPNCPAGASGCSPSNCLPNPVPAPPLPHFKCYKIKAKQCLAADCTAFTKFAKTKFVNLRTQFGQELNVPVGNPRLICAPALKEVVGETTTTTVTTTTTTSTTTTTICHFDPTSPTGCVGQCPATAPPGSQCVRIAPDKCDCVAPPVCCECPGAGCFDTNGQCPAGCFGVAGADCNAATGHCQCGFCRDAAVCTTIACSANQPCPTGTICDPVQCPRPCGGPCDQPAGQCTPEQCFKSDGTPGQCRVTPIDPCGCCGPGGSSCTTDFDCCSGICNAGICSP